MYSDNCPGDPHHIASPGTPAAATIAPPPPPVNRRLDGASRRTMLRARPWRLRGDCRLRLHGPAAGVRRRARRHGRRGIRRRHCSGRACRS